MQTDSLGRYYTGTGISSLLVQSLHFLWPSTILDIGVGDGSLAKAAMLRYKSANIITADIEEKRKSIIEASPERIKFIHADGLNHNLNKKLNIRVGQVDVAVCNPPYHKLKMNESYRKILRLAGFASLADKERLTCDILFLAQNLRLLKPGGEIGIILPDTLLSGSAFANFRQDLFQTTKILGVIQLPIRIFSRVTEALTHILLLRKEKIIDDYEIPVRLANDNGKIIDTICVKSPNMLARMDYSFHKRVPFSIDSEQTLHSIGCIIIRGCRSKKELVCSLGKTGFFHLNDFRSYSQKLDDLHFKGKMISSKYAQAGDILFARVGKRVLGKVAFLKSGKIEISDCIYAIRAPEQYQTKLYQYLKSDIVQEYLKTISAGVCSRFIAKEELLKLPIKLQD